MAEPRKVFCVGMNKTGTSSLKTCFERLGIVPVAGPQSDPGARGLFRRLFRTGDYRPAIEHARGFVGFEDRPWNVWEMYRHLDAAFPDSRFILTLRDSKTWWRSVEHWLDKKPQMINVYRTHLRAESVCESEFVAGFERHNRAIIDHFAGSQRLLVLDLEAGDGWEKLCAFLDRPVPDARFPRRNAQRYRQPAAADGEPPLVSVLVPVRDGAGTVAEAIRSALDQSWPRVEVIVVDDGSQDATADVLRSFGDRIRWESQPPLGQNAARNRLLELSQGEWLSYLDADDLLFPDKIERQMRAVEGRKAELVASGCVTEAGRLMHVPNHEDPWICWLSSRLGVTSANLFRRQAIVGVGAWDPKRQTSQEYALMAAMLRKGCRVLQVPGPLAVKRRVHRASVWHRDIPAARHGVVRNVTGAVRWLAAERALTPERRRSAGVRLLKSASYLRSVGDGRWVEALRQAEDLGLSRRELAAESPRWYRVAFSAFGFDAAERIATTLRRGPPAARKRGRVASRRALKRLLRGSRRGARGVLGALRRLRLVRAAARALRS